MKKILIIPALLLALASFGQQIKEKTGYADSAVSGTLGADAPDLNNAWIVLSPAATLTIGPSGEKLVTNKLKMMSGASMLGNSNLVITSGGTAVINRNLTGNWTGGVPNPSSPPICHYVSSPVSAGTAGTFSGGLANSYNETTQNWEEITVATTPLEVGRGYNIIIPSTRDVTFTGGNPNWGNVSLSALSYTPGGNLAYVGWHLLGNPFPSALDWTKDGWNRSNVDGTVYTWNSSNGNYVSWVQTGDFGTMTDGIIPAGQGFMVHVTAAGTGSITIPEAARVHDIQPFYKSAIPALLNMEITGNSYSDKIVIHLDDHATNGFDPEYDSYKLSGIEPAPQLWSILPGCNLSVSTIPSIDKNPVIPLGVKVGAAGSYSVTAAGMETFAAGTNIYLEDLLAGKTTRLNDIPTYTFTAGPSDAEHRFNLLFNLADIDEPVASAPRVVVYSYNKTVYVNIPFSINGKIMICSMLGTIVSRTKAEGNSLNRIPLEAVSGYYIVKVIGDKGITTAKVYIH